MEKVKLIRKSILFVITFLVHLKLYLKLAKFSIPLPLTLNQQQLNYICHQNYTWFLCKDIIRGYVTSSFLMEKPFFHVCIKVGRKIGGS